MTEKNILQNWFVTGAKPTQEQFWGGMCVGGLCHH